jgi:hypothetical protein
MTHAARLAKSYADINYPWACKGQKTRAVYDAIMSGTGFEGLGY